MLTRTLRILLPVACLAAACGGNVVVDEAGSGGSGGSGGAPVTNTSSTTTTTPTSTSTSVTSTSVTSSSGPSDCDNTGNCNDGSGNDCLTCALNGPCFDPLDTCQNNQGCLDFASCIDSCAPDDQGCIGQCSAQSPEGSALYAALFDCVFCFACPIDCANPPYADPSPGCP